MTELFVYSLNKDENKNITKNFKVKEFSCKDGSDKIIIDLHLVDKLQFIRDYINKPIKIISGYRTEKYNEQVGGAKESYHVKGRAVDIQVDGFDIYKLAIIAGMTGFSGIGIYEKQKFIHLDNREKLLLWENK